MTLWEFITLTVEWIQAEVNNLGLGNQMRAASNRVTAWWSYGRRLARRGLIVVLVLNILGFVLGWIFGSGTFNAIAGLVIAPIILVMLAWWAPLAGVLGIAAEIVHGKWRTSLQGGARWAEGWMKIALGILMWQLILSFFLSFVPYWNAPARVPVMALSALLIIVTSFVWGGGKWYRKVVRVSVISVFALNIVFCFWPATAKAVATRFEKADELNARKVERGGIVRLLIPIADASTGGISPIELEKGIYPITQNMGEISGWIEPQGAGRYWIDSPDGGFLILTPGGAKIPSSDVSRWPKSGPFKIYALTDQRSSTLHIE